MAEPVNLDVTAGLPYMRSIRVTDAKNTWATIGSLEVRAEVRAGRTVGTKLLTELTDYLTASFDGNDLVIALSMTGEQTRNLTVGTTYYDFVVSDTGTVDARAIRILHGDFKVSRLVTAAADV